MSQVTAPKKKIQVRNKYCILWFQEFRSYDIHRARRKVLHLAYIWPSECHANLVDLRFLCYSMPEMWLGQQLLRNTALQLHVALFRVIRVINIHKKKRERLTKLIFCLPCSIGPEADWSVQHAGGLLCAHRWNIFGILCALRWDLLEKKSRWKENQQFSKVDNLCADLSF